MSDDQRQGLLAEVTLGIEAESFLGSGVGRYLVAKAEAEVEEAVDKLKVCNFRDSEIIRELQNQIYRAESVQCWLAECIQSGWNAENVIKQADEGS